MSDRKELESKLKEIQKDLGIKIQFADEEAAIEYYPVGVSFLDEFMGGGLVRGRFTVIYGGKSCGKSTLSYNAIAEMQGKKKVCAIIDMEHSFDTLRASSLGVNLKDLILIESCDTAEQAMDLVIAFAKAKIVDFVVIDSVQAMSPEGEQESKKGKVKSVSDDTQALLARKLGQFFRMCATSLYESNMSALLIGQVRVKGIGTPFVKDHLSGGKALEHWPWEIIYVRRGQSADAPVRKDKETFLDPDNKQHTRTVETVIGFDAVLKMEKSKASKSVRENQEIHLPFYFTTGFKNEPFLSDENRKSVERGIEDAKAGRLVERPLSETNPYATDKKALLRSVITSTAIEGVHFTEKDLTDKPKGKRGRPAGAKNKKEKK